MVWMHLLIEFSPVMLLFRQSFTTCEIVLVYKLVLLNPGLGALSEIKKNKTKEKKKVIGGSRVNLIYFLSNLGLIFPQRRSILGKDVVRSLDFAVS